MGSRVRLTAILLAVCCALIVFCMAPPSMAGAISGLTVTPTDGTSNSIWYIEFRYQDTDGKMPFIVMDPTPNTDPTDDFTKVYPGFTITVSHGADGPASSVDVYKDTLEWVSGGVTSTAGALFRVRASAGLDLSKGLNPQDKRIIRLWTLCASVARGQAGKAQPITVSVTGLMDPTAAGGAPTKIGPAEFKATAHDSATYVVGKDHAGISYDRDYLRAYDTPFDRHGDPVSAQLLAIDPLNTSRFSDEWVWVTPDHPEAPGSDGSASSLDTPDDGTSASTYTFRVMYYNDDNLPPQAYISQWGSMWPYIALRDGDVKSGVVLYIGQVGGSYKALPMQKVDPANNNYSAGVLYEYKFVAGASNGFVSLPVGNYKYFFACSDDYLKDAYGDPLTWADPAGSFAPWLSPYPNLMHGHPWGSVEEQLSRHNKYNYSIYADRPTLEPGVSNDGQAYPYLATAHPTVYMSLDNSLNLLNGRRYASISPGVEMAHPQNELSYPGGTTSTQWQFQVTYKDLDNISPEDAQGAGGEVSLHVSGKPGVSGDINSNYWRYTMVREAGYENAQARDGIVYTLAKPITLPPGAHDFYYTAGDGKRRTRYPVDAPAGLYQYRGPFVNTAPTLSEPTVTPSAGSTGQDYMFSVKYADADGQRPYQAHVIIQWRDGGTLENGGAVRCAMVKANPNANDYKAGVVYVFHSANLVQKMQPGERKFYFEFIDDWGRPSDPNHRVMGETVWSPGAPTSSGPNWISGPYISQNHKPELSKGAAISPDGTANGATLWNYKVTYKDSDNQVPSYVNVYIGREVDANVLGGKKIEWLGAGHAMAEVDANDHVYSDGKEYKFQTTLTGADPANKYFYVFVASDGIDVAEFNPTSSDSACLVAKEALAPKDTANTKFQTSNAPIITDSFGGADFSAPWIRGAGGAVVSSYQMNAMSGDITTYTGYDSLLIDYWRALVGPSVGPNTPPTLSDGAVSPKFGGSSDVFNFSVVYTDVDGSFGQKPQYVRVVIDSSRIVDMATSDTKQIYRDGVRYDANMKLSNGVHTYYFIATDGAGYAVFDNTGGRNSAHELSEITPITGPYVNDVPTLSNGQIAPNPPEGITSKQAVTYSVVYNDNDNDAPNATFPEVFVDNPDENTWDGTVTALVPSGFDFSIQTQTKPVTDDLLRGMYVQLTSGPSAGRAFIINSNTDSRMILADAGAINVGDTFCVGKLIMVKSDPRQDNFTSGVGYEYILSGLTVGTHKAHFKALTTETIGANQTRVSVSRYPSDPSKELDGPTVVSNPPFGNTAPVLSQPTISAQTVKIGDSIAFSVNYLDAEGNAPSIHDGVKGYVQLRVTDRTGFDRVFRMSTTDPNVDYTKGALFSCTVSGLAKGPYTYRFEASDGWLITSLPPYPNTLAFRIDAPPALVSGIVSPLSGNSGLSYDYSVLYQDEDNDKPQSISVVIDGVEHPMASAVTGASDYITGVKYVYTMPKNTLTDGTHTYQFKAYDGFYAVSTASQNGPNIHPNNAPVLTAAEVTPQVGWVEDTYRFRVTALDPDGDELAYIKLFLDDPNSDPNDPTSGIAMTKVSGDPSTGVIYEASKGGLSVGTHKFHFATSDRASVTRLPKTGESDGPTVNEHPVAIMTLNCADSPMIGEKCAVTGKVETDIHAPITLTLQFKNVLNQSSEKSIVTDAAGNLSMDWVPDMNGGWTIKAVWAGDGRYLHSESTTIAPLVAGPTWSTNGLDMVSVPMIPNDTEPYKVFGETPAFALALWSTDWLDYKVWSTLPEIKGDPGFDDVAPGVGYWIKSKEAKTIAPIGKLVSTQEPFTVWLKAGWNLIGCPFTHSVAYSDLKVNRNGQITSLANAAANGIVNSYAWTYDRTTGAYKLVDAVKTGAIRNMEPWHGYWIKAALDCGLVIPVPATAAAKSPKPVTGVTSAQAASDPLVWGLQLVASNGRLKDDCNYLGVTKGAAEHLECPRAFQNFVDLYFTGKSGRRYASDIRTGVKAGDEWSFSVETDTAGVVSLAWEGLGTLPATLDLALVDESDGAVYDVKAGGSFKYEVGKGGSIRSFRIVVR